MDERIRIQERISARKLQVNRFKIIRDKKDNENKRLILGKS
jgi:hypothetical protein